MKRPRANTQAPVVPLFESLTALELAVRRKHYTRPEDKLVSYVLDSIPKVDSGDRVNLSEEAIEQCFASGGRPPRSNEIDLKRLFYCLTNNIISLSAYVLPEYPAPPSEDKYATLVHKTAFRDSGGPAHGDLKWRTWHWMHDLWSANGDFEISRSFLRVSSGAHRLETYRFDVFCELADLNGDKKLCAGECGDSDVAKVLGCLGNVDDDHSGPGVDLFAIVPFTNNLTLLLQPTAEGLGRLKTHQRTRHDVAFLTRQFNERQHTSEPLIQSDFMAGRYEPEFLGVPPRDPWWKDKKLKFVSRQKDK